MSRENASASAGRMSSLHRFLTDKENREEVLGVTGQPPDSLLLWLSSLVLLSGVPFEYLVADDKMLPPESIRFFIIDENWVERMIDGALSVAGQTDLDQLITETLASAFRQPVQSSVAASLRPRLLGIEPTKIAPEKLVWPLTGFLIRSVVVDHWKGIEIENKSLAQPEVSLSTLRLDRPAKGVLLGLYNGVLGELTFKHPPESLHFGVTGQEDRTRTWTQRLRDLDGKLNGETAHVALRDESTRVIDVLATRDNMASCLKIKPDTITSAELALEMIESPKAVTFKMSYPSAEGDTNR